MSQLRKRCIAGLALGLMFALVFACPYFSPAQAPSIKPYGCKLLKQESVQAIIQPYLAGYGLGLWVSERKVNNQTIHVAERQGAIWGTKTRLLHVPEKALTVILLSNAQTTSIDQLQDTILADLIR